MIAKKRYSLRLKVDAVESEDGTWNWVSEVEFKAVTAGFDVRDREVALLKSAIDSLERELEDVKVRGVAP